MSTSELPADGARADSTALSRGSTHDFSLTRGLLRRALAVARLTLRDAIRNRMLLWMTVLMCAFAGGSLLWPADLDRDRVKLVQQFCYTTLTLFGLIAAAFAGGSSLPKDVTTKRIYSIATKPLSRLELLLGKVLGMMGVMGVYLVLGGLITFAVANTASARKTYPGGSYTVEMLRTEEIAAGEGGNRRAVTLHAGQELVADRPVEDGYEVTVSGRDFGLSGVVPASAVRLHVRTLEVERVAEPDRVVAHGNGRVQERHGELFLDCTALATGDDWTFDLSNVDLPLGRAEIDIRFRFVGLLFEPLRRGRQSNTRPVATLRFARPDGGRPVEKTLRFSLPQLESETPGGDPRYADHYEESFTLPLELLRGGKLTMTVVDHTPKYAPSGRIRYDARRQPTWAIRHFSMGDLPPGKQRLRFEFIVSRSVGFSFGDKIAARAVLRNPRTDKSKTFELRLRNKVPTFVEFDRGLIDPEQGIEVRIRDIDSGEGISHYSGQSPVHLMLEPGRFWASTARSILMLFLYLCTFATLAVTLSTFLSGPVATLVAAVTAVFGMLVETVREMHEESALSGVGGIRGVFRQALDGAVTPLDAASDILMQSLLSLWAFLIPGYGAYDSSDFVAAGRTVEWSSVFGAVGHALPYTVLCFLLGYLVLRKREFG
jgi:hypothetical protein